MKRLFAATFALLMATSAAAQTTPATPQYIRVWDFADVRTAAFDESFADFRAYLDTRPGYFGYSYYSGDNGHRYLIAALPNRFADIQRQDSITSAFSNAWPNTPAFTAKWSLTYGGFSESVWRSMPAQSLPPTGTSAEIRTKYPFRRMTVRYVRPEAVADFEAAIKDVKAVDERIGSTVPVVMYRLVFGAHAPAYLFISYAENNKSYWEASEARRIKRDADPSYAGISRRISAALHSAENISLTRNAKLSYAP